MSAGSLLVGLLLLVLTASGARAQISPGPLARPHQNLEGSSNCTSCHSRSKENMDQNCLSCHGEIRQRRDEGRGLHARTGEKTCASCHPDHAGREFQLIFWGEEGQAAFDHRRTGWPLAGKHADVECRECHTAKFQSGSVTALIRMQPTSRSWLGLRTECLACHPNQHEGKFGTECASCHGLSGWKQLVQTDAFPHDRTRFPLRGKHAQVPCASCHDPVQAWGTKPAFDRCGSCHADPHAGTATLAGKPVDCASCHDETGFRTSTFTVARHARTGYPLAGKHATVVCRSCHTGPEGASASKLGSAGVRMHPAHEACASCHPAAHGEQLTSREDGGACESCHTVDGWRPSLFTASEHAALPFPLEGAHREASCRSCHGPERPGLPALPGRKTTGSAGVMLALEEAACQDCHQDAHRGRYTSAEGGAFSECASCHSTESFHATRVDVAFHDRFEYPLRGAHRAVPCFLCHGELQHEPAPSTLVQAGTPVPDLPFSGSRKECESCHQDPHGGQFAAGTDATPCAACHDESTFRPAVRFDHDRDSRFALAGAHERVPCGKCHPAGTSGEGKRQVLYKPLDPTCRSCHGG